MNVKSVLILSVVVLSSCAVPKEKDATPTNLPIIGTWRLITGTLIEKGDTTVTDYTKDNSFIKIINQTHFAFLQHNLKDKDSTGSLSAGGGRYSLKDSLYTEHLEYCSDRKWEGNDFIFTITMKNDTLTQTGIEKIESAGINRINEERYKRLQ